MEMCSTHCDVECGGGRVGADTREEFSGSVEQHLQRKLVTRQRCVVHRIVTLVVADGCYGVVTQQVLDNSEKILNYKFTLHFRAVTLVLRSLGVGVGRSCVVQRSAPSHVLDVDLRTRQHQRHDHTVVTVGGCVVQRRSKAQRRIGIQQ